MLSSTTILPLLSLLSSSALALTATTYTANFTVGDSTPVDFSKPYDGLFYSDFGRQPFDYQSGACAYLCPQSFPSLAGFTANPGAQANISAKYDKSKVQYFELSDLYFGCNGYFTTPQDKNFESPVNCTLHISAYTSPSKPAVATQSFTYKPNITPNHNTGAPSAPMAHVVLGKAFQKTGITFVRFTAEGPKEGYAYGQGPFPQSVPDALFDDVRYTVFSS